MQYVFTGFRDIDAVRHFGFDRISEDKSRTKVTVDANMAMARQNKILLQDLPLLCLRLLESLNGGSASERVILSEAMMLDISNAARVANEKKVPKRPRPSPAVGQAWRGPALHPVSLPAAPSQVEPA